MDIAGSCMAVAIYCTVLFLKTFQVRMYDSTTRMLIAVILLFLLVELVAASIFMAHIFIVAGVLSRNLYVYLNTVAILRNAFMFITNPLKFVIYCAVSTTFRETFISRCRSENFLNSNSRPVALWLLLNFSHCVSLCFFWSYVLRKITWKARIAKWLVSFNSSRNPRSTSLPS